MEVTVRINDDKAAEAAELFERRWVYLSDDERLRLQGLIVLFGTYVMTHIMYDLRKEEK